MQDLLRHTLISVPYGIRTNRITTPRYRWRCWERGETAFVILQWTSSGSGWFGSESRGDLVRPGQAFVAICPERSEYFYPPDATEPWCFSWINFYGELAIQLWREIRGAFGPILPIPADSPAGIALNELIRDTEAHAFRDPFEASSHAFTFITQLLRQLVNPRDSGTGPIEAALQFVSSHPAGRITVKELAALTGLSREHFTRLFQAEMGESPAHWLRNKRLDEAENLLKSTGMPLGEVALRCGFASPRHLREAFRGRFGKLPTEWREKQE